MFCHDKCCSCMKHINSLKKNFFMLGYEYDQTYLFDLSRLI